MEAIEISFQNLSFHVSSLSSTSTDSISVLKRWVQWMDVEERPLDNTAHCSLLFFPFFWKKRTRERAVSPKVWLVTSGIYGPVVSKEERERKTTRAMIPVTNHDILLKAGQITSLKKEKVIWQQPLKDILGPPFGYSFHQRRVNRLLKAVPKDCGPRSLLHEGKGNRPGRSSLSIAGLGSLSFYWRRDTNSWLTGERQRYER